uniref:Ig-like domain-containing protein n=1 Tax=Strigamia maritima TaxID=126957 RepID=T1J413_STRMM
MSLTRIILLLLVVVTISQTHFVNSLLTTTNPASESHTFVEQEPVIFENSTKSVVVSRGLSVQLSCYASGVPQPRIYWHRVNYILLSTGGSIHRGYLLNITNATIADRGIYYCIADNGVGDGARRHVKVEVEFSPTVSVPLTRVAQALNHNVDLECHIEAYPPPSAITWIKDSVLFTNSVYYFSSRTNEHIVSILRVQKIDESRYGNYTCKATNSLGSNVATVELIESEVPVCPTTCTQQSTMETNIEVEI